MGAHRVEAGVLADSAEIRHCDPHVSQIHPAQHRYVRRHALHSAGYAAEMSPAEASQRPHVFVAGPVSWNLLIYLRELPRPESHMTFAQKYHETLGGTSAGKTMNLCRLGAEVTLRTLIGDDDDGRRILTLLRAEGATVIAEIDPDGHTEKHVNLMSEAGGRVSLYLSMPTLVETLHKAQTFAALADADAVVIDLADSARPMLREAIRLGSPIWVDLHDYDGVDEFRAEFIAGASHLCMSSDRMPDPRPFMTERIATGANLVVCTHGVRGASALDAAGRWYDVPAVPVDEVVDTNGAGDAFFSAFMLAYLRGAAVDAALTQAAVHAARCVQSPELAP
jgi:sugar/nucleoside kinase (ribokinase family)